MVKIKIKDLQQEMKISNQDMRTIMGGRKHIIPPKIPCGSLAVGGVVTAVPITHDDDDEAQP